jgi:hypothetical protein
VLTTTVKSGCGCGAGGSGGCTCGRGSAVCTDLNFKRPRFFAGQLLTEDDLQALTDYVIGKNRLHNRFLFGDGVVCGLTVTCHPCGGKVTVAPGFALDCCGNDLLVPCKEDLDVKALIRDLRKRQLAGYDCGDPCDEKDPDKRTYGLYLTYTETLEDPVAPYASGDPCGQQACEPTRVCEGYRFELRCDCDLPARADLLKRISDCIGDLRLATAAISKAQTAQAKARQIDSAVFAIRAEAPIPFEAASIRTLSKVTPELAQLNDISIDDDIDGEGVMKRRIDEQALRLHVAQMQVLTGAITRFRALPSTEQLLVLKANAGLKDLLGEAEAAIAAAGPRIEMLAPNTLKTPIARTEAEEAVRLSQKYVIEKRSDENYASDEARLVALNTPLSSKQVGRIKDDAALLKDWLLDKLDYSPSLTRCDLAHRLRRVRIEAVPGRDQESDIAELSATSRAVQDLVQILFEYLIDCICLALNPPCQPCEDQGVLLACLTVKECEVVDICNMSRRFVLTPVAMRYWLPPIGAVGELLKRICCDLDIGKLFGGKRRHEKDDPHVVVSALSAARAEDMVISRTYAPSVGEAEIDDDTALVLRQFRIEPRELETTTLFLSNLALLSVHAAEIDPGALVNRGDAIAESIGRRLPGRAPQFDQAKLRKHLNEAVAEEVAVSRKSVERELAASLGKTVDASITELRTDLADSVTKDLEGPLEQRVADEVKSALARELTEANLRRAIQSTDTVKALQEESRKLTRDLKKISDAVDALKKGGTA